MDSLQQRLLDFSPVWTYVAVALLVFAEESMVLGLLVPGDTAAILAGVAASQGHLGLPMTLGLVIVSAVIGASVGFGLGRRYGERILPPVSRVLLSGAPHWSWRDTLWASLLRRSPSESTPAC